MKDLKHIRRFNKASENLNISDVSESKITKRKLLNKLMNIMMELDNEGKIEDIGEKGTNPHIHEFMIDGYLFQINLIDEV